MFDLRLFNFNSNLYDLYGFKNFNLKFCKKNLNHIIFMNLLYNMFVFKKIFIKKYCDCRSLFNILNPWKLAIEIARLVVDLPAGK